jgi:hypothetical protein
MLVPFAGAISFESGVAAIKPFAANTWEFIDTSGRSVSQDVYDRVSSFSEGLAAAWRGRRCGYVSVSGSVVIPLAYVTCEPFRDGLALVRGGSNGLHFIDRTGTVAIPGPFTEAESFWGGYARVVPVVPPDTNRKGIVHIPFESFQLIDTRGKTVFTCSEEIAGGTGN